MKFVFFFVHVGTLARFMYLLLPKLGHPPLEHIYHRWADVSNAEQFCVALFTGRGGSAASAALCGGEAPKFVASELPNLKDCFDASCGRDGCQEGLPRVGCGFRSKECRKWLLCRLRLLADSDSAPPVLLPAGGSEVSTDLKHRTLTASSTPQSHYAKLLRKRLLRVSQSLRFYRILVSAAKKGLRRRNSRRRESETKRGVSDSYSACEHPTLFPTVVALLPSILTLALQLTLCSNRLSHSACTAWQKQSKATQSSILLGRTLQLQLKWLAAEVGAALQDVLDGVVGYGQTRDNVGSNFERDCSAIHLVCHTLLHAMKFQQSTSVAHHAESSFARSCLQSVAAEVCFHATFLIAVQLLLFRYVLKMLASTAAATTTIVIACWIVSFSFVDAP